MKALKNGTLKLPEKNEEKGPSAPKYFLMWDNDGHVIHKQTRQDVLDTILYGEPRRFKNVRVTLPPPKTKAPSNTLFILFLINVLTVAPVMSSSC